MKKRAIGFAAVIAALFGCSSEAPETAATSRPELIVIFSVDTLRADRLGVYGYENASTPHIDDFASEAVLFESAFAQAPLTLPSHVSMLTGRTPAETGVRDNLGFRLDPSIPSIPVALAEQGYRTAGFVSSWVLRSETGLSTIFDSWDDEIVGGGVDAVGELSRPGAETVDRAITWLDRTAGPRFLFVHIFEPHAPYEPTPEFAGSSSPYDGEVAASDELFGRFLDAMRARDLYDDSLIIFLSDHGEGLGDHGESEHGIFLYREAIRVPLIVKLPDSNRGRRIAAPVALLDIPATIGEITGLAGRTFESDGKSLMPLVEGAAAEGNRTITSETMYPRIHLGWSELVSVVEGDHHFIDAPAVELYDMTTDPGERENIANDERRVVARLRELTGSYDRTIRPMAAIDPGEAEKLASLGYLSGGSAPEGSLPDPKEKIGELETFTGAHALLQEGKAGHAVENLEKLLDGNPHFADAWILLARAYERMNRLEDANTSYRRAIETAPNLAAGTSLSIARVLTALGRFEEAVEHADLAETQHPEAARIARARARLLAGNAAAAEVELSELRTGDPLYAEAMLVRSQIEIARRQPEKALAALDQAAGAARKPLETLEMLRADALARLGRIDEAKQSFRREIELFPHNREAYLRLIAIHVLERSFEQAERTAESLERANPGSSPMIADAYRKLGREDLASKWSR
ncbi:MAG: sulfatase-like hydrolase/transferase [Acidobacteria bacterium]|nr:sulfatase-like hydrolase/transferase [Acidobacteriota bacterium]